jgi:hypothetical protein
MNYQFAMENNTFRMHDLWCYLTKKGLATEQECELVLRINGHKLSSLESILYIRTGYKTLEDIDKAGIRYQDKY